MEEAQTEQDLALAIQDKQRFVSLTSHIGLTGAFGDDQASQRATRPATERVRMRACEHVCV